MFELQGVSCEDVHEQDLTRSSNSRAIASLDFSMRATVSASVVTPLFNLVLANSMAPKVLSCLSKCYQPPIYNGEETY